LRLFWLFPQTTAVLPLKTLLAEYLLTFEIINIQNFLQKANEKI